MSYCFDFDECDCDCHHYEPGMVLHCMPCCYPCSKCGKKIKAGLHSLHFENCEGTMNLSSEELLTLDLNTLSENT